MISELELVACAHLTLEQHGDRAALFVAERLGEVALKGDIDGIRVWKAIARRIDEIQRRGSPH